ncbi:MAG: PRC-barrel domain-containing protein [Sporomusaceae bacterium]|nr:PRC-barrel domain-containing protein [Sporomusaceae bacterium]
MKKSTELIGLPIISISEGIEFGKVRDLLINAAIGTVSGLVLEIDEKKWYLGAMLVPFESVVGIGDSALIIDNGKDIIPVSAREEFGIFFEANVKIIGTKVLTRNGKFHGKVKEFFVDVTGKIESCEMEKTDGTSVNIEAERIITFGKEILIIHDEEGAVASANPDKAEKKPAAPEVKPAAPAPASQPTVAATPPAAPTAPNVPAEPPKKPEAKPRELLIGKRAAARIESDNGALIIDKGGVVTEEVLQKATLANKLIDLSMSVI